jgi:SpoVK/Ycf46/Vps4 family AAA+-type ATPase
LRKDNRLTSPELDQLAAQFPFTPRTIARAIRRTEASEGHELDHAALADACRELGRAEMSGLAHVLPQPYTREQLVVPIELAAELDLAGAWLRHRRQVLDRWGFGTRVAMGRGLTALFAGPPGTGKTMSAQVLARELGLELFRVDLSRVMSKYIGETEKNLARLFDDASACGAVLFFDEADALFGKRSAVKDAHDRYANVEIGYLLQRMEEHDGATVLATNRSSDLDDAFLRRFHFILDFPLPGPADRLRIWEGMFAGTTARAPDLDLRLFAQSFEISGGEIKNCVLAAAYLAAAEERPIGASHIQRAIRRELAKSGRLLDDRHRSALG